MTSLIKLSKNIKNQGINLDNICSNGSLTNNTKSKLFSYTINQKTNKNTFLKTPKASLISCVETKNETMDSTIMAEKKDSHGLQCIRGANLKLNPLLVDALKIREIQDGVNKYQDLNQLKTTSPSFSRRGSLINMNCKNKGLEKGQNKKCNFLVLPQLMSKCSLNKINNMSLIRKDIHERRFNSCEVRDPRRERKKQDKQLSKIQQDIKIRTINYEDNNDDSVGVEGNKLLCDEKENKQANDHIKKQVNCNNSKPCSSYGRRE